MAYSSTVQSYVTIVAGFDAQTGLTGSLNITTTLAQATPTIGFSRMRVPPGSINPLISKDTVLQLTPVNPDTFTELTFVAIAPSFAPPAPAPAGQRLISQAYGVYASSVLTKTNRPMLLEMHYTGLPLGGVDPHTLAIFAWDAAHGRWDDLGGQVDLDHSIVSVATSRFTTYALMATTTWRDEFEDLNLAGLAARDNIDQGVLGDHLALVLGNAPGSGAATSIPISPTTDFAGWGSLSFAGASDSPTTTLTVDVLSITGTVVLSDVASGTSLAAIDAARFPKLQLRARFTSATPASPALDWWRLTWLAEPPPMEPRWYVFTPLIVR